jgi:hypothetical protein
MLSDVCFSFNHAVADGMPMREAAKQLLECVEHYTSPCYDYHPVQIEALRSTGKAVLANPEDAHLARWLALLCEAVCSFDDLPPHELKRCKRAVARIGSGLTAAFQLGEKQ